MSGGGKEAILTEQIAYYRARAAEYDEWFLRTGRYDRGEAHRRSWFAEVGTVEAALDACRPRGDVLELACGTGIWTKRLAALDCRLTALDASPEALELNRHAVNRDDVRYVCADIFAWRPPRRYDFVFCGFWLSHVPRERFGAFFRLVASCLKPHGTAFVVDSLLTQESTARDHAPLDTTGVVRRRLNDGREYRIVKIFYDPPTLESELDAAGWDASIASSGEFFLYGTAQPRAGFSSAR